MVAVEGAVISGARAVKPAIEVSRVALRKLRRLGTFDVRWVQLGDSQALTAKETSDLEQFLSARETRALLSVLATTLLMRASDARDEALGTVRDIFMNSMQQYWADNPGGWYARREVIWESLLRIYDEATPAGEQLAEAAVEIEDFLRTPISRGQKGSQNSTIRYVARLSELCSDIGRVADGLDNAERIRDAISSSPAPPIITYTDAVIQASFEDLYVQRTLINSETKLPFEGHLRGRSDSPFRAVVHGAPGTGKSTFVQNLRRQLALDPESFLPILLTARKYFPAANSLSVVEYLASTLQATVNFDLSVDDVRDLLTLGLATVIFDGLDEVTDIHLRIELVERICSFAAEFPTVSILVTSRSVGYERAPLPEFSFSTLTLNEYSPKQSTEYVQRWFAANGRPELVPDFERESETIKDLKQNPLLLSLLCALYRERGSIPRRRRQIYQECADLLFHKWDSHRHIHQPEELHANGDRIMQELARWVYNSTKAQNGLPEGVITKTIGGYLRDALGVEEGEARRRAAEFLEFCANRAWLLGRTGTDHGERMFGFTHRTFFEYFAAESFSRTSGDPSRIAQILIDAHKRDTTSVLPELLLQAIDDRLDQGAAQTFKKVCDQTTDELLILRLLEGAPLPTSARERGFDAMMKIWWQNRVVSRAASTALLLINSDARGQFLRDYVQPNREGALPLFLGVWASVCLASNTSRLPADWGDAANEAGKDEPDLMDDWFRSSIAVWRWRQGLGAMPVKDSYLYTARGVSGSVIGTLWLGIEIAADGGGKPQEEEWLWATAVGRAKDARKGLTQGWAENYTTQVLKRIDAYGMPDTDGWEGDRFAALVYAVGIVYECIWMDDEAADHFLVNLPRSIQEFCRHRGRIMAREDDATPPQFKATGVPVWVAEWVNAKRSFILDPHTIVDSQGVPIQPRRRANRRGRATHRGPALD